ncbi:hypothetical protein Bca101_061020 [Brassica carinata]
MLQRNAFEEHNTTLVRCNCINWDPDKSGEEGHAVKHSHEHTEHQHICQCLRVVAGNCVPGSDGIA